MLLQQDGLALVVAEEGRCFGLLQIDNLISSSRDPLLLKMAPNMLGLRSCLLCTILEDDSRQQDMALGVVMPMSATEMAILRRYSVALWPM